MKFPKKALALTGLMALAGQAVVGYALNIMQLLQRLPVRGVIGPHFGYRQVEGSVAGPDRKHGGQPALSLDRCSATQHA